MKNIYSLQPIDKTAARVVSQTNCSDDCLLHNRQEILETINRIKKRQVELKKLLGIKTKNQYKNRKYYRKHPRQRYNIKDKRAFEELMAINQKITDLQMVLHDIRR